MTNFQPQFQGIKNQKFENLKIFCLNLNIQGPGIVEKSENSNF